MRKRAAIETADPVRPALDLFEVRGWEAFDFQVEVWRAYLAGKSGLIHSATGTGKTLAAWMGPLLESGIGDLGSRIGIHPEAVSATVMRKRKLPKPQPHGAAGLKVLWLTPLRALAADTVNALRAPLADL